MSSLPSAAVDLIKIGEKPNPNTNLPKAKFGVVAMVSGNGFIMIRFLQDIAYCHTCVQAVK